MISEKQQEQAGLYALGAMTPDEQSAFEAELRDNAGLRDLVFSCQRAAAALAISDPNPQAALPPGLIGRVLAHLDQRKEAGMSVEALSGLRFQPANDMIGWKQLAVPGAWIKLLSLDKERGYAVLLGRLDAGVRYPAHVNAGPEDFYIVSGDLVVGERRLGPGDFHHADKGSHHDENHSVNGCTLVAVLTIDDPLVAFAMA